jgi:ABC-type branched-subunit amino acid transport system permease subunit
VIIGGMGSFYGTLAGIVLGVTQAVGFRFVPAGIWFGIVFTTMLVFRPGSPVSPERAEASP